VKVADFIGGNESDKSKVASWMYDWRRLADKRKQSQSSKTQESSSAGQSAKEKKKTKRSSSRRDDYSESSDDDYEDDENEMVSKTVFLFGSSGVGKSAFVHACAAEYNFQD
jgi:putative ribosome biogenesis GTPase RsgA